MKKIKKHLDYSEYRTYDVSVWSSGAGEVANALHLGCLSRLEACFLLN